MLRPVVSSILVGWLCFACHSATERAGEAPAGEKPALAVAAPAAPAAAEEAAPGAPIPPAIAVPSSSALAPTLKITPEERSSLWENGLWLRVFQIDGALTELVELMPGQTPNVSRVVSAVDLGEARQDFGLESNYFYRFFLCLCSCIC